MGFRFLLGNGVFVLVMIAIAPAQSEDKLYLAPLKLNPPHIATDSTVRYDYDIVYVRAPVTVT
jgi:hypothetical protein